MTPIQEKNLKSLQDFFGAKFEFDPERNRYVTKGSNGRIILAINEFGVSTAVSVGNSGFRCEQFCKS